LVYGAPRSVLEARETLQDIRGLSGEILTAYHYIDMATGLSKTDIVITAIRISNINDYEIEAYINTGEIYQAPAGLSNGRGSFLIDSSMGDLHNIYGISIVSLKSAMREFGNNLYEYWKV
jgi:septum formation protein